MLLRPYHRRRRHLTGLLVSALLAGTFAAVPAAAAPGPRDELPPQEPGVTLRVFDLQTPSTNCARSRPGRHPTSTS